MDNVTTDEVMAQLQKERAPKQENFFISAIDPKENLFREPTESELVFFKQRPDVGGMMTQEDFMVTTNPYSTLNPDEKKQILRNELARVVMHRTKVPEFALTPEQEVQFSKINQGKPYGSPEDTRATILARILTGDQSAMKPTNDQIKYANFLKEAVDNYMKNFK
jgi:hypothetical protein